MRPASEAFFCIVDLHAITVDYDPADLRARLARPRSAPLRDRTRPGALDGLRAEPRARRMRRRRGCSAAVTSYGQLGRMTQFKEKGDRQEFVSAALFSTRS